MAVGIPTDFNVVAVRGHFAAFDGESLTGTVTFAPSIASMVSPSNGTVILARPIVGKVVDGVLYNQAGSGPLYLYATDDSDVSAQDWTYSVTESLNGGSGRPRYNISVPVSTPAPGLDLWKVAPEPSASGTGAVAYVLLPAFTALESRVVSLETSGGFGGAGGVRHLQDTAAATWSILHTLAREPIVSVYIDGVQVEADVAASTTDVVLTFPAPMTGVAVLN